MSLEGKKIILEDLGVPADKVARINSAAEADEVIVYYQKKVPADKKENMLVLPNAAGVKPGELPPPDATVTKQRFNEQESFTSRFDPLHPIHENRRNEAARSLMIFDEDGNPRLF